MDAAACLETIRAVRGAAAGSLDREKEGAGAVILWSSGDLRKQKRAAAQSDRRPTGNCRFFFSGRRSTGTRPQNYCRCFSFFWLRVAARPARDHIITAPFLFLFAIENPRGWPAETRRRPPTARGRIRTNADASKRLRTLPDASGRLRTLPDASGRGCVLGAVAAGAAGVRDVLYS